MKRILALSVVVATLVTTMPYMSAAVQGELTAPFQQMVEAKQQAASYRERMRLHDRYLNYERALAVYKRLIAEGIDPETLVTPDPNKPTSLTPYLRGTWKVKMKKIEKEKDEDSAEEAEEQEEVEAPKPVKPKKLRIEELKEGQLNRLERFVKVGQCPVSLKEYIPGFYELCRSLVRQQIYRAEKPDLINRLSRIRFNHSSATKHYQLEKVQELEREAR